MTGFGFFTTCLATYVFGLPVAAYVMNRFDLFTREDTREMAIIIWPATAFFWSMVGIVVGLVYLPFITTRHFYRLGDKACKSKGR